MRRKPETCFFVILFEGRTGSSFTVSCLNSHPNVLCYPEVLAHRSAKEQRQLLKHIFLGKPLERLPFVMLNKRYFHGGIVPVQPLQCVGFKTKLQDVARVSKFHGYLHDHNFRMIYLRRRNLIKSALSMLNAHRLVQKFGQGHWNASHKEQVQGAMYVSPDDLLAELTVRIRHEVWHQRFFDLYAGKKRVFFYEDLVRDARAFLEGVQDFLDVPYHDLKGVFLKNTPDRLTDAILNYDEIYALFEDTCFERFFEEEDTDV